VGWVSGSNQLSIFRISSSGSVSDKLFGPFPGWTYIGLTTGADGNERISWQSTSGQVSLWSINPSWTVTYQNYGPYSGWNLLGMDAVPF
jgi:hypothetical protein